MFFIFFSIHEANESPSPEVYSISFHTGCHFDQRTHKQNDSGMCLDRSVHLSLHCPAVLAGLTEGFSLC